MGLREAAQQALEALEDSHQNINPERRYADELTRQIADSITALRAALADMELVAPLNREEILRMALEAGGDQSESGYAEWHEDWFVMPPDALVRFAALFTAAEREACSKVCEEHWRNNGNAMECADAIRARVKK